MIYTPGFEKVDNFPSKIFYVYERSKSGNELHCFKSERYDSEPVLSEIDYFEYFFIGVLI